MTRHEQEKYVDIDIDQLDSKCLNQSFNDKSKIIPITQLLNNETSDDYEAQEVDDTRETTHA